MLVLAYWTVYIMGLLWYIFTGWYYKKYRIRLIGYDYNSLLIWFFIFIGLGIALNVMKDTVLGTVAFIILLSVSNLVRRAIEPKNVRQ